MSPAEYEAYRRLSRDERRGAFGSMSASERAELIKAQIRAWMETNRSWLSPEQVAVLEENIAFLRPELYQHPVSAELDGGKRELLRRTAAVLDLDQMAQALMIHGADIPTFSDSELELREIPANPRCRIHLTIVAARPGATAARLRVYAAASEVERLVADREVLVCDPEDSNPNITIPDPPMTRIEDLWSELQLGETDELLRVTITPLSPGSRLWGTVAVRRGDGEAVKIISPVSRA